MESATLHYHEGASDKVYQCQIEPAGERIVLNFAYGRRSSTLDTGSKTKVPVDYESAKRIYDKLVQKNRAKATPKAKRCTEEGLEWSGGRIADGEIGSKS